jgi:hypothetical protein
MMEKLAQAGGGGGVYAHPPFIRFTIMYMMQCTLQLRGQIHSPYFISTPMYSVDGKAKSLHT